MIALDTNVLARFYCDDPEDPEAGRQRPIARRIVLGSNAVDLHRRGLDFADALHWACSRGCERFVTFDDRRLARRARRLGLAPEIVLAR
jgi:predicted nucleic acid-binding protein